MSALVRQAVSGTLTKSWTVIAFAVAVLYFLNLHRLYQVYGDAALAFVVLWLPFLAWRTGPKGGFLLGLLANALHWPLMPERFAILSSSHLPLFLVNLAGGTATGFLGQQWRIHQARERALRLLGTAGRVAATTGEWPALPERLCRSAALEGGYPAVLFFEVDEARRVELSAWHLASATRVLKPTNRHLEVYDRGRRLASIDLEALSPWIPAEVVSVESDGNPKAFSKLAAALSLPRLVLVPVPCKDRVSAVLALGERERRPLTPGEDEALSEVGLVLGAARERFRLKEALERQAVTDPLTGLQNRRGFALSGQAMLERARSRGRRAALLYLDLDRFQMVNDTLGHAAGDQVLREAATRLLRALREEDLLARIGGDEFAVLLVGDRETAEALAKELGSVLSHPFAIAGRSFTLSTSIGIAIAPDDGVEIEDLLRKADVAMYQAKRLGRPVLFYNPRSDQALRERQALEEDFRKALKNGEITPYYQPVISLRQRRVAFFEALARWRVSPAVFIPLAQELGLADALDRAILERVAADLARWRRAGHAITASVNVTPTTLATGDFLPFVLETLKTHGLPPEALILEITESSFLGSSGERALEALHQAGFSLAVDDFGTGYSSLARLKHLPLDYVKVPYEFTRELPGSSADAAIVTAIHIAGDELGFETIAEGVEREAQARFLKEIGYDLLQGFLIAKAMPADEALAWFREARSRISALSL